MSYTDPIQECCCTLGLSLATFFHLAVANQHVEFTNPREVEQKQLANYKAKRRIPDYFYHYARQSLKAATDNRIAA